MARGELVRRVDGIGQGSVNGTLAALLSLTSEAVLAFDGLGRILLANERAQALLSHEGENLVGGDVRSLFPPAVGTAPKTPFSPADLPFALDGSAGSVLCLCPDGRPVDLALRCVRLPSAGDTYLLVARQSDSAQAARGEHERLVGELSRANKRLSGTLRIVLETLGSGDVTTLFERVLEEVTSTMEASGTVFYVAESDGYHLRGVSSSLVGVRVPRFLPAGSTLEALSVRAREALRLRVLAPGQEELRRGRLTQRELVNEETREVYRVRASHLPPFSSLICVPVWFGGHVIALIEVGWQQAHATRHEDGELLDAVTQYLSVQLVGAFSALRRHKEEELRELGIQLHDHVLAADDARTAISEATERVCRSLGVVALQLVPPGSGDSGFSLELPGGDLRRVGPDLDALLGEHGSDQAAVLPLRLAPDLQEWLQEQGASPLGALVDLGTLWGERRVVLLSRPADGEPLDDVEVGFLRTVAQGLGDISRGEEERRQDRRISQALQTGMKNELQRVPGITAQGIYSSATAAAVIGGDFYDLIRLPDRRSCVIMGDVSGKGVEAASVSAAVRTALGAYSWQGLSPARMVGLLNDFLLGFSRLETFATLFVGVTDLGAGTLTYCSAGHPPAILVRSSTSQVEALDVQSGVVGAFHEMRYRNGSVRLEPGDMLLLYTDGTTEARATDGSFFGEDGLRDAVMSEFPRSFEGVLDRLLARLDTFTERHLDDDVAMVSLRFDDVCGHVGA